MSDDLVKRLREHTIHLDAWGKEAIPDANIVEEAADRIEQLEMLLHGEKCLRQDLKDTAEAHSKQQLDRIEKLEAALQAVSMWKLREQLGADKSRYGVPTNEHFYDHVVVGLREEAASDPRVWSKNLAEDAADYIEGMQYQLRCDHSWKYWAEKFKAALKKIEGLYEGEEIADGVYIRDTAFEMNDKIHKIVCDTLEGEDD